MGQRHFSPISYWICCARRESVENFQCWWWRTHWRGWMHIKKKKKTNEENQAFWPDACWCTFSCSRENKATLSVAHTKVPEPVHLKGIEHLVFGRIEPLDWWCIVVYRASVYLVFGECVHDVNVDIYNNRKSRWWCILCKVCVCGAAYI